MNRINRSYGNVWFMCVYWVSLLQLYVLYNIVCIQNRFCNNFDAICVIFLQSMYHSLHFGGDTKLIKVFSMSIIIISKKHVSLNSNEKIYLWHLTELKAESIWCFWYLFHCLFGDSIKLKFLEMTIYVRRHK